MEAQGQPLGVIGGMGRPNSRGRRFIFTLATGLAALVLLSAQPAQAQFTQSPLLTPFAQDLRGVGPGGIPVAVPDGVRHWPGRVTANHYTIDINQFTDTLHPDLPPTTLWGYNPRNALGVVGVLGGASGLLDFGSHFSPAGDFAREKAALRVGWTKFARRVRN